MVGCVKETVSAIMNISVDLNGSDDDRFSQLVDEVEIKLIKFTRVTKTQEM